MSELKETKGKPFTTDEEAEHFLDTADLSEYDFSGFKRVTFELRRKDARLNMRLPQSLLNSVRAAAAERGIPYQRFIRDAIERALPPAKPTK